MAGAGVGSTLVVVAAVVVFVVRAGPSAVGCAGLLEQLAATAQSAHRAPRHRADPAPVRGR